MVGVVQLVSFYMFYAIYIYKYVHNFVKYIYIYTWIANINWNIYIYYLYTCASASARTRFLSNIREKQHQPFPNDFYPRYQKGTILTIQNSPLHSPTCLVTLFLLVLFLLKLIQFQHISPWDFGWLCKFRPSPIIRNTPTFRQIL